MILLHRITPFLIGASTLTGFVLASSLPSHSGWLLPLLFLLIFILFARLLNWRPHKTESWLLLGTPLMLLFASEVVFLFLDSATLRLGLSVIAAFFLYFYAEHLFGFVHLPVFYQPHALQNLTMVLQVLAMFFFVAGLHAFVLFVPFIPLIVLVILLIPYTCASIFLSLWMGKAPRDIQRRYAVGGTILFTELFIALSFLPSTFTTSAALLAICFYLFLGLTRAHVQAKLTRRLVRRYLGLSFLMLVLVIMSARWT